MTTAFAAAVARVRRGEISADAAAAELLAQLTDPERLGLLDGDVTVWHGLVDMARHGYNREPVVAGAVGRLGIPGIRFTDGPRGVVIGHSTCFPVALARGASWDPALETEVGRAMGREARAQGANLFAGVCVNLLRHPAWGRAQETYGEDPVLVGQMGAALTQGVREQVMACVKHFALNSIENSRFAVDVVVDDDVLHEVYLPHFRTVVEAGADAVMSAYNSVNGEWAGQHRTLLTDVLRGEWGFTGFVMSDFVFGLRDAVRSLTAGLDLEMPYRQQRAHDLPGALASGRLARADVDRAGRRLLATQLRHQACLGPAPSADVVAGADHRALAQRAAAAGMVLLRNEAVAGQTAPLLPLDPTALRRVAVLGPLSDAATMGDTGSSLVRPPASCGPLQGLREALPGVTVHQHDGADVAAATRLAAAADVAVVVVGSTSRDEGEALLAFDGDALALLGGPTRWRPVRAAVPWLLHQVGARGGRAGGDRARLTLRDRDEALVRAVAATNPRTVVVVVGTVVVMERWRHDVPAVLLSWYAGMEGGRALADVLTGAAEPGGRLPVAVPTDEAHLPFFQPVIRRIMYDRWWGQRKLDRDGRPAAYPLGFGLGYTTCTLTSLTVDPAPAGGAAGDVGTVAAAVTVQNTGSRAGSTVVQLYAVRDDPALADRPLRQLLGFVRVHLGPGERRRVQVTGSLRPLARRDPATRTWGILPGRYRLEAAQHSGDPAAASTGLLLP